MKRYPEYKDSDVEFIGEIPKHWEFKKLGYVSKIFKGGTPKRHIDRYFQGDLPWARPVDITALNGALYIDDTEIHISEEALGNSAARRLPVGTVLLTSRATIGETAITTVPMATNQGFANFVCDEALFNNYLVYYLRAIKDWLISLGSGTTFLEVTKRTLVGLKMPLPPLSEQKQIANFLNRKTEQIDELIRIKERMVELLQEQRTALINQTVTKGLDPNVEMKPSGVKWIEEIPRDWSIMKVKYLTHQIIDGTHYTPEYQDSGIPFLRITDIHAKTIDLTKVRYITPELHQELTRRCKPEKGDLLLSKNGTIGITRVIDWDFEFSIFVSLCLIKFRTEIYSPHFFSYLFQSQTIDQQLAESSKTATVTNLHLDKIRELFVINPPLSEQQAIVDFLDHKTAKIDELRSNEQRSLELLKEYRHTLISEVVTGKLDVRSEV